MHTTNYQETFIEPAEDCPVEEAVTPPSTAARKTVANLQYEMLADAPYRYTSDDVIFAVHAERAGIPESDWPAERERLFSRGQACLRASPLAKRYGWGFHFDADGRVALVPSGSEEYRRLAADPALRRLKAMRSKRA